VNEFVDAEKLIDEDWKYNPPKIKRVTAHTESPIPRLASGQTSSVLPGASGPTNSSAQSLSPGCAARIKPA